MQIGLEHYVKILQVITNPLVFDCSSIKECIVHFLENIYNGLKSDIPYICDCSDQIIKFAFTVIQKCLLCKKLTFSFVSHENRNTKRPGSQV